MSRGVGLVPPYELWLQQRRRPGVYPMDYRTPILVTALIVLFPGTKPLVGAPPLQVHGALSASASYSDEYNFLGDTRDHVKINLVDVIINGTRRFDNGLRLGAQVYAYRIGDFDDIALDFANVDYPFKDWLGLRVGRNKLPHGLYNDSQDLDTVRTFASLPIAYYPKTLRAITNSFDGACAYGNVGLKRAGSVDYQLYAGAKEDISGKTPWIRGLDNLTNIAHVEANGGLYGGSWFWNPPLSGLKLGYSYLRFPKNSFPAVLNVTSQMHGTQLATALLVDRLMGAGAWDYSGKFAGTPARTSDVNIVFRSLSAEYLWRDWVFAAEFQMRDTVNGKMTVPAFALLGQPTTITYNMYYEIYYGMVSYQATKQLGLGAYYCYSTNARKNATDRAKPDNYSHDYCAAVSYSLSDQWLLKAEYHYWDGRDQVVSSGDDNRTSGTRPTWNYVMLKTTFAF